MQLPQYGPEEQQVARLFGRDGQQVLPAVDFPEHLIVPGTAEPGGRGRLGGYGIGKRFSPGTKQGGAVHTSPQAVMDASGEVMVIKPVHLVPVGARCPHQAF